MEDIQLKQFIDKVIEQSKDFLAKENLNYSLCWFTNKTTPIYHSVLLLDTIRNKFKSLLLLKKHILSEKVIAYIIVKKGTTKVKKSPDDFIQPFNPYQKSKDIKAKNTLLTNIKDDYTDKPALIFCFVSKEEKKKMILPYEEDKDYHTFKFDKLIEEPAKGGAMFSLLR